MSLYWMKRSGDIDGRVPVTSTKYSINKMKLSIKTAWHPWFLTKHQVLHGSIYLEYFNTRFCFKKLKIFKLPLLNSEDNFFCCCHRLVAIHKCMRET